MSEEPKKKLTTLEQLNKFGQSPELESETSFLGQLALNIFKKEIMNKSGMIT